MRRGRGEGAIMAPAAGYHGDRSEFEKRCNEACTCFQKGKSKPSQTNDWFPTFISL